ncbi:MAG: hypothetical protein OXC05_02240 [Halieaceae bacterium]|nr:hypothetical protein [Halieaceae bacterium]
MSESTFAAVISCGASFWLGEPLFFRPQFREKMSLNLRGSTNINTSVNLS